MKKVGIFSGTFDPVHEGHVSFVREALKLSKLDKVFFLVEPNPRRKQGVKSFQHRVNMVRLAIEDESKLGLIILEQARFTVPETMPILKSRFKGAKLCLLMGEDVIYNLASWPHADRLIEDVHFMIGTRRSERDLQKHIKAIEQAKGKPLSHSVFRTAESKLSSTAVRAKLRKGQQPKGVHPEVLAYIELNGLYSPAKNEKP